MSDWIRLLVATVARGAIGLVVALAFWGAAPTVLGWHPTTVMTGSMQPSLRPGDVVVSRPVSPVQLRVGQVLLFPNPDHPGQLRLHRFAKVGENGSIVTKGDANPQDDSTSVARTSVSGVGFLHVPFVGLPVLWLRGGQFVPVAAVILGMAFIGFLSTVDRPLRAENAPSQGAESPSRNGTDADVDAEARARRKRHRHRVRSRRYGLNQAGLAVLLAVALSGAASLHPVRAFATPFKAVDTTPASTFAASSSWPCLGRAITNSPSVEYSFNAASGSSETNLGSSAASAGALTGGVTRFGGTCASSPYATFDGSKASVITSGTITAPSTFTIETWFTTSTTNGGKLLGFGSGTIAASATVDRQLYVTSSGKLAGGIIVGALLNLGGQTLIATSTQSVNDGKWHDAALTWDGSTLTLSLDGVTVATATPPLLALTIPSYTGTWHVGGDSLPTAWAGSNGNGFFAGSLDDPSVYAPLTAAQVSALYGLGR